MKNSYEMETVETVITMDNLDSKTKYTINVVAETSAGRGTSLVTVTVETRKSSVFLQPRKYNAVNPPTNTGSSVINVNYNILTA